jgi:nucleoside-diphosphate-sugar epimerase
MADKVLVTGISGFLGGHVALALLNAGYQVRGSVRDLGKADKVRATLRKASASGHIEGLEFVALDLMRDDGWQQAAEGCRFLQHVASPFVVQMPTDKDELIRPAVEGTRRAINAALAAGIERIVLTSSFAAIGYGHPKDRTAPFTETDWSATSGDDVTAYTESKTRAELEAWSIMEAAGRRDDLVVVNPTAIMGPLLDNDPGTSGALVLRLLNGSVPATPRLNFGIIDVRDVAQVQVKAMETQSAGGKRFIASAGNLSFKGAADALRPALPAYAGKIPRFELPDWVVRIVALFDADIRGNVNSLGKVKVIDARQGEALLGHPFITPAIATVAMGQSLIDQKLV